MTKTILDVANAHREFAEESLAIAETHGLSQATIERRRREADELHEAVRAIRRYDITSKAELLIAVQDLYIGEAAAAGLRFISCYVREDARLAA